MSHQQVTQVEGTDALSLSTTNEPAKILLVDDEKLARMLTRRRLERLGHTVIEAPDGEKGLEIVRSHRPDLVISDWMMPNMDGPTFCEAVKSDPVTASTPFVLMTALDQPAQIAEGLHRGADDFLAKSASDQEITARVNAGLRMARLIANLAETNNQLSQKQEELHAELESASNFVASLLPKPGYPVPTVRLDWTFVPSLDLGGDLFQVTQWGEEYLGLVILDMSGHGVGPALRAVSLAMGFRDQHMRQTHPTYDPGEILGQLNRDNPITEDGAYFTIWIGCLHLPTNELRYATAGHPGTILISPSGVSSILGDQSWPIGFGLEETYETHRVMLGSGFRLYLYSDGIYEIMSPDEKLWDREGLLAACEKAAGMSLKESLSSIVREAQAWQQQEAFGDDMALVGMEIVPGVE